MKIIKACDWEQINLLTEQDPNKFGEALRAYCFVGNCEQRGCYSTFNVLDCFEKVESGLIFEEAKIKLFEDIEPTVYHYKLEEKDCFLKYINDEDKYKKMRIGEPYELVIGWTWDGDGYLYFRFNDRKVINRDCKKDYNWAWC